MIRYDLVSLDATWDAHLKQMPNWNIFQTSDWMNTYVSVYFPEGKARGLMIESDETITGMIPMVTLNRFGCRITGSPLRHSLTPFIGFAWNGSLPDCLQTYLEFCRKSRINFSTITFSDDRAGDFAGPLGYRIKKYASATTHLGDALDVLWKQVAGIRRNRIRRGEKEGFTIGVFPASDIMPDYLRLRKELYDRQGIESAAANSFLQEVCSVLPPDSFRFFAALDGSTLAAAAILLLYRNTCFAWDNVSNIQYKKSSPGSNVNWRTVLWGKENGYDTFNWGGANTPSIADFKYSFGSIRRDYVMLETFSPGSLSLAIDLLRKYRSGKNPKLRKTANAEKERTV